MSKLCIGFLGKSGVGKTTAASRIADRLPMVSVIGFADPLRDLIGDVFTRPEKVQQAKAMRGLLFPSKYSIEKHCIGDWKRFAMEAIGHNLKSWRGESLLVDYVIHSEDDMQASAMIDEDDYSMPEVFIHPDVRYPAELSHCDLVIAMILDGDSSADAAISPLVEKMLSEESGFVDHCADVMRPGTELHMARMGTREELSTVVEEIVMQFLTNKQSRLSRAFQEQVQG